MNILCRLGKHDAVEEHLWNNGNYFTHCARCERVLVRKDGPWKAVPRGHKVVWRPRTEFDIELGGMGKEPGSTRDVLKQARRFLRIQVISSTPPFRAQKPGALLLVSAFRKDGSSSFLSTPSFAPMPSRALARSHGHPAEVQLHAMPRCTILH